MSSRLQSTRSVVENAISASTLTDETAVETTLHATNTQVIATTVGIQSDIPHHWAVLIPADELEAKRVVELAGTMKRPVLIGVSDRPVEQSTKASDVIDIGQPNLYGTAGQVTIACSGPVLDVALAASERLRAGGINVSVAHFLSVQPLQLDEPDLVNSTSVVVVIGHPLATGLADALRTGLPDTDVHETAATIPGILDAVSSLLYESDEGNTTMTSNTLGRARFAQRMEQLGTENAFEVLAVVNKLKAEGRDIISFAIGEPDFPTPANIRQAGTDAIADEKTHYSESQGILPLRQAIVDYISRTRGVAYTPENVVVTPGAKPIMFNTIMSVVNPGDEVLYPNPGFPIYESLIDFIGAKAVPLPLREELRFNFDADDLRRLVTPKTRLIILNTPQNPTGGVLSDETLRAVAEVAQERDLWVLSDEVYSQMVYDGEFQSIAALPGMADRTIILDGFSKTYSMTGWRLGFGVMPADLAKLQSRIETNLNSCTATFTQWAGVEALNGSQEESRAMIAEFRRRRDIIVDGLNTIPGFNCQSPGGAFYVWPNVTEACRMKGVETAKEFQEKILFEASVAVLPRTSFGRKAADETEEYIRFSYATAEDLILQGLDRIRKWMEA
jgi:aspartate aminotransferase